MPVERRGWVTHGVCWVNGRPEEPSSFAGRRQPSLSGTSRMRRESHVRICERLGVKFPGPTRRVARQAEQAADNRPNGAMPALRAEVEHPSGVVLKAKAGGDRLHLLDKSRLADPRFAAYSHDRAGRTLPD